MLTSYSAVKNPLNQRRLWWVVDATGWHVGRLATQVVRVLQGKHKPFFNPAIDCGDHVLVLNAHKVEFSGDKWKQKLYRWHTGWKGGLKEVPVRRWRERHPERILEHAVSGMLPKNRTRRLRENRLVCINGETHPHISQLAQNPWKMATRHPMTAVEGLPRVAGYFVTLKDEEEKLILEMEPYTPAADKAKAAERTRKAGLQKALKAYLVGRGPRPDFLPQPPKKD